MASHQDEPTPGKLATDAAHALFIESTTILWMVYKHTLSRPARLLVPDHTREAIFQAFCDLRTNSPKDRKWMRRHWNALQPRTANGWLAFSASLISASAVLAGLLCALTALLTFGLYTLLFVSIIAGIATGTCLTAISVTMMVAAGVAGSVAAFLGWGYAVVETTTRGLSWTRSSVLSPLAEWTGSTLNTPLRSSAQPPPPPTEPATLKAVHSDDDVSPHQGGLSSDSSAYPGDAESSGHKLGGPNGVAASGGFSSAGGGNSSFGGGGESTVTRAEGVHLANGAVKQGVDPAVAGGRAVAA